MYLEPIPTSHFQKGIQPHHGLGIERLHEWSLQMNLTIAFKYPAV